MVVTSNLDTISKLGQMMAATDSKTAKENKLATGQKVVNDAAASLSISDHLKQKLKAEADVAAENLLSSESDVMDIARADEMIRQANSNILNQADDAVKVQSGQNAAATIELLR